ncbi:hypothetical protein OE88DRAFT_1806106 [Heliocybe sulcata]|uniref:Uncharacterized protein n=1 Tax=Heliocybe sulcata TaxID=5364 RepID=A0A5C3N9L0_9AGAM|nr:hypothetical protein OE88DRAFT_1806106 [Heliocybe sulcata]
MSLLSTLLWVAFLSLRPRSVKARRPRFRFRRDDDSSSSSDSDSDNHCNRICRSRRRKARLSKGAIAGIVIGIVIFLVLFFLVIWLCRRRRRQKRLQEKTIAILEQRRNDDPLPPIVPPKNDESARRRNSDLLIPASLTPSSPTGRAFTSTRNISPSSPTGTHSDFAFLRSLGHSHSQRSTGPGTHEMTEETITSMGNLGHSGSQRSADSGPHERRGGDVASVAMGNLGHAQSQRSTSSNPHENIIRNLGASMLHPSAGDASFPYPTTAQLDPLDRSQSPLGPIGPLPNPHERDVPSNLAQSNTIPSGLSGPRPASLGLTHSNTMSSSSPSVYANTSMAPRRASTLHEEMTMYQKKLEVHDQEEAQIARERAEGEDPPPQYEQGASVGR